MTDEEIKKIVGSNIAYFRTRAGFKQSELAELLNYSDKSISKWERGDGTPDITVLVKLSEIFDVGIGQFLSEERTDFSPHKRRKQIIIPIISIALVYFIASILFMLLKIVNSYFDFYFIVPWLIYIFAICFASIIGIVFSKIWKNRKVTFVSVSALCWSVALSLHFTFSFAYPIQYSYLTYSAAFVFQIIIILWFLMKKRKNEY